MALLAPLDRNQLMSVGLAGPADANGMRRIHKRRLNRSSDEENAHMPLVPISTPQAADWFVDVPDELISMASLRYLGLTEAKASELWRKWTNWPSSPPGRETDDPFGGVPFIDFVLGHVKNREFDPSGENDGEWCTSMVSSGVSTELQDAIMDPIFRRIRLTESSVFWVRDTIAMRYRGLEEIQRASREREMALQRAATRPSSSDSRSPLGSSDTSVPASSSTPHNSEADGRRSFSASQRLNPGIDKATAMSATALSASHAPGYTMVFKGLDQARINGM